jgi:hypothetical protein
MKRWGGLTRRMTTMETPMVTRKADWLLLFFTTVVSVWERQQERKHTRRGNEGAGTFTTGVVEATCDAGDGGIRTEIGGDDDGKGHRRRRGSNRGSGSVSEGTTI